MSEIFRISQKPKPYSICSFARSRELQSGGLKFGSKEIRHPLSFAAFSAFFVASRELRIYFLRLQHHIRSRIAVEGELSVPVRKCMDKRKGGVHLFIHHKMGRVDPGFCYRISQKPAELILSYLSEDVF